MNKMLPVRRGPGRPPKYPLRTLAVGESIFIPGTTQKKINRVRRCYFPMKFRVRTFTRGGEIGVRIWRIA